MADNSSWVKALKDINSLLTELNRSGRIPKAPDETGMDGQLVTWSSHLGKFVATGTTVTTIIEQIGDEGAFIHLSGDTVTGVLVMTKQYGSQEYDAGNSGSSAIIDWNNGNSQKITLTSNCTIGFTNSFSGGRYLLNVIQDGVDTFNITWPVNVKWPNDTTPVSPAAGKQGEYAFVDRGSHYHGTRSGDYSS